MVLDLAELVARIREGYEESTPGQGYHWLYRHDEISGSEKLARRFKTPDEFNEDDRKAIAAANGKEHKPVKTLIETKGQGGFVIIAPSNGKVHPTGGAYKLVSGGLETIVTLTKEEHDAIRNLARTFDEMPEAAQPQPKPKAPVTGRKDFPDQGKSPGDDYEERESWPGLLEQWGWVADHQRGDIIYWTRPGKDKGVSATTGHCKGLKVFTTSTPFSTQGTYTKFGAFTLLQYGGNFTESVKALAANGYGTWIDNDETEKQNPPPKDWKRSPKCKPHVETTATKEKSRAKVESPDSIHQTEWGTPAGLWLFTAKKSAIAKMGKWFIWDGRRWRIDDTNEIYRCAKDVIRAIHRDASLAADDEIKALARWAIASESDYTLKGTISLTRSEPGISITTDQLDANPWILNTPGGTVNLKTGNIRPAHQEDLITKITSTPVDMEADCPQWKRVILEIMDNNQVMVDYLQRALGYSLTGDVSEHAMFLCYGSGRNGKNTILDTVKSLLGDYAWVVDPKCFLSGRDGHPTSLAALAGRRFVPTDEVDDGEKLAEGLIKRVTGNKTLNARFMRQDEFEFLIQFKLWFACNHKPEVKGTDEGIWSRLRLIPFNVYFPPEKRIKGLSEILVQEEGPAILGWLINGCRKWLRGGLNEPQSVLDATKEYRSEQDVLSAFLEECCVSRLDHPNKTQFKTNAVIFTARMPTGQAVKRTSCHHASSERTEGQRV